MNGWPAGPWTIGTETRGYKLCTFHGVPTQPTEDGKGQQWIYVYPPRVIDGEWLWPTPEQTYAAAVLMTAAPDLAEACEEAIQQIEYLHGRFEATGTGNTVLAKLRAALAKARGE